MSRILPIDPQTLLERRGAESERIEYKASWDPKTTGFQVLKTICAFANDLRNLNGGYLVLGVAEREGRAASPPRGLSDEEIQAAQRWIRGQCRRIEPPCYPIMSPETIAGRRVLVLWVPASDARPHRAPDGTRREKKYWVRVGAETVDAGRSEGLLPSLIALTSRIPWDDRAAIEGSVKDLRTGRVREYLHDVNGGLLEETIAASLFRRMRITRRANGHEVPRNVGLLFFSDDPTEWFPGARIEVTRFAADIPDEVGEERVFRGGLADQLRTCLRYLDGQVSTYVRKSDTRPEARHWSDYPPAALREALVNAVYHRSYEPEYAPTRVLFYPSRIEIISYPGPIEGIERRHFTADALPPAEVSPRNRRIGEFLKELRLAEERLTGVPRIFRAMRANGSPDPVFDFDDRRRYFRVLLPRVDASLAGRAPDPAVSGQPAR